MKITIADLKEQPIYGSYIQSRNSLYVLKTFLEETDLKDPEKITENLNKMSRELIKLYPNMVAVRKKLTTIVYYMKRLVKAKKSLQDVKQLTVDKIHELIKLAEQNIKNIGINGSKLILNHNKLLTISYSNSLKEIFITAHKQKRKFEIYCLESRPTFEGHIFAEELTRAGIACSIVTDASMAYVANDVNVIISGADRVYENAFVNKIGTFPLAIIAKEFQIPFYMVCDTEKIFKEIDHAVRYYPRNSEEVYNSKIKSLNVLNYCYESIPLNYVSKVINEEGIYDTTEFINWYLEE